MKNLSTVDLQDIIEIGKFEREYAGINNKSIFDLLTINKTQSLFYYDKQIKQSVNIKSIKVDREFIKEKDGIYIRNLFVDLSNSYQCEAVENQTPEHLPYDRFSPMPQALKLPKKEIRRLGFLIHPKIDLKNKKYISNSLITNADIRLFDTFQINHSDGKFINTRYYNKIIENDTFYAILNRPLYERDQSILWLNSIKDSDTEIAKELGIDRRTVQKVLLNHGKILIKKKHKPHYDKKINNEIFVIVVPLLYNIKISLLIFLS